MTNMTGGAAVVEGLRQEGVTHVFGVIGTALLELYDALVDSPDITYVGARHEQNAVHMADAYARVSGRPGVVLAGQPGPGVTNLASGIAEARLAYSPVVVIAGGTVTYHADRDTFQEIDQHAMLAPISKRVWTARSAMRLPEYLREAFRVAMSGRRGPVVVNVPADLLAEKVDVQFQAPKHYRTDLAGAPPVELVRAAADLLNSSVRPFIIAGAGVKWSGGSTAASALAERLNAPIGASGGHGDVIPNDSPLFVGQVGPRGNRVATGLAKEADVILALGTRLGLNTTLFSSENISPSAKIIQVDIDGSAVGRYFPIEIGMVGDACRTAEALAGLVESHPERMAWTRQATADRAQLLAERAKEWQAATLPLHPKAVCHAIQPELPRDTIITIDTGTTALALTDEIQTYHPPALVAPLDFGLVGFGFAAGLGAKVASPDRPVVSLIGDGGFSISMAELGSAVDAGISTVTVVLNNRCWGAEKAYQRDFFGGRFLGSDITNPAFDQIAAAYGCMGIRADGPAELAAAVRAGLDSRVPVVIEVAVNPDSMSSFRRDSFTHRSKAVGR